MSEWFDQNLQEFFGASEGACSPVTQDEFNKSQVTFVGPEQKLIESFLGDKLAGHYGSIKTILAAGLNPEFSFRMFPSGQNISLTVSYKTGRPNELRFYLRKDLFKPNPGEFWGIFIRSNELWLCHFSIFLKEKIQAGEFLGQDRNDLLELEVDGYQDAINNNLPAQIISSSRKWSRDPKVASQALVQSKYKCELFPKWPVFTSRKNGMAFMEAHHLVPMNQQEFFKDTVNLDCIENICILNPLAHRMLHHAPIDEIIQPLRQLASRRIEFLKKCDLIEDDILSLYA